MAIVLNFQCPYLSLPKLAIMKTLLIQLTILISTLFLFTSTYSQSADKTPLKCKWNLKDTLFGSYDSVRLISYGKSTIPNDCIAYSDSLDKQEEGCHPVDTCFFGV